MNLETKIANAEARKVQQFKDQIATFAVVVDRLPPLPEHCPPRNCSGDGPEFPDEHVRSKYEHYQSALRHHENAKRDLLQARQLLRKAEQEVEDGCKAREEALCAQHGHGAVAS